MIGLIVRNISVSVTGGLLGLSAQLGYNLQNLQAVYREIEITIALKLINPPTLRTYCYRKVRYIFT